MVVSAVPAHLFIAGTPRVRLGNGLHRGVAEIGLILVNREGKIQHQVIPIKNIQGGI
jgi:hypothetical protein